MKRLGSLNICKEVFAIIILDLHRFNLNPPWSLSLSFLLDLAPNAYRISFFIAMNILFLYTFEPRDTAFCVTLEFL